MNNLKVYIGGEKGEGKTIMIMVICFLICCCSFTFFSLGFSFGVDKMVGKQLDSTTQYATDSLKRSEESASAKNLIR